MIRLRNKVRSNTAIGGGVQRAISPASGFSKAVVAALVASAAGDLVAAAERVRFLPAVTSGSVAYIDPLCNNERNALQITGKSLMYMSEL